MEQLYNIEPKEFKVLDRVDDAVGAGVDIDELSTVLRGNTAFIY